MKKRNPYNALIYLFVFTLAYILGIHSATPKGRDEKEYVTVSARLKGDAALPRESDVCYIDKVTRLTVISAEEYGEFHLVTFLCEGKFYPAGFLSSGGKFLTVNQPISAVFQDGTRTGRIISILRGAKV